MVGGLFTWHNWNSTLLVAVELGIRLPNYSIFWGGSGMGWGARLGGGARLGRGENTFPSLSICIASLCLLMPYCDIDLCS